MPRLIEILLFLTPFVGFTVWRLVFPSPTPPLWLTAGFAAFVAVMLVALLWVRQLDANDASQPYHPAEIRDGKVIEPAVRQ